MTHSVQPIFSHGDVMIGVLTHDRNCEPCSAKAQELWDDHHAQYVKWPLMSSLIEDRYRQIMSDMGGLNR